MVERITISMPKWMKTELSDRQTDGKSEHIREALLARWRDEDDGDWVPPEDEQTAVAEG